LKKSKSSAKLLNASKFQENSKDENIKNVFNNNINQENNKRCIKNLNPNILNIIRKKGANLTKESKEKFVFRLEEGKENEFIYTQKNDLLKEKKKEINHRTENTRKFAIANKKNTSSPYLIKNQRKLPEAHLENSPNAISRNSSNISILEYKLDKNIHDYNNFDRKYKNIFENSNEISALNPLMLANSYSNSNLHEVFKSRESFEDKKQSNNKLKSSLPRSISNINNDLCVVNIDKEIYNTILQNIHNNLHNKEQIEMQLVKSTNTEKEPSADSINEPHHDLISENSFKIKHQKFKSKLLKEEINNSNKIKKLKINLNNNYASDINGYAPLVKKSEIINNNIYNHYEYRDENNKKVVFKTKVLESSQLLLLNKIEQAEEEKEILCFDSTNKNDDLHVKELKSFKWDNLHLYNVKQEKLAKKQSMGIEPTKKLSFFSVFTRVVKDQMIRKVDSDKMKKAFMIFLVTLMIQLILSRK